MPNCIISDLDGTLSLMNGRSPYRGEDCASDLPNKPIIDLVNRCHHHKESPVKVFLFSGRNGESIEQTKLWLDENLVQYDKLVMREPKNQEKDSDLKERFYKEHIEGKYNVLFILDDRNQVVDMWRNKLNLTCLQVAEGNF